MKITKKIFQEATGFPPKQDDLARCNCNLAGEIGHDFCGWNYEQNKPRFMTLEPVTKRRLPQS
jgi:hypothetical protein